MSPRGGPGVPRPRASKPIHDRFMPKVKASATGCWEWQGYIMPNGYGYFRHPETKWAHRVSYMIHVGPIPEGLHIDHLCRNKRCVNPDHLDPVTRSVNMRRAKAWTTCPRLHPSAPSRFALRKDGKRYCRECARVAEQRRRDGRALRAAKISDPRGANAERSTHSQPDKSPGQGGEHERNRSGNCNRAWVRSPSA